LAAAALQMGRILDDRTLVTTQPSAARQLERFMVVLRRDDAALLRRPLRIDHVLGVRMVFGWRAPWVKALTPFRRSGSFAIC
jgi:hypothetical protein